jgi:transposase
MKRIENELHHHYALLLGVKSPWAVKGVKLDVAGKRIEIGVEWTPGQEVPCPQCGKFCALADHAPERRWRHLDTMQFETVIRVRVPRSRCLEHGVKTIALPWAEPGSRFTLFFERFALDVLRASRSLTQACALLGLDWDAMQRIMDRAVGRGLKRRKKQAVAHVGIDEKSFGAGQSYISLLSDLKQSRVLEVVEGCDQEAAQTLWESLPRAQPGQSRGGGPGHGAGLHRGHSSQRAPGRVGA